MRANVVQLILSVCPVCEDSGPGRIVSTAGGLENCLFPVLCAL